MHVTVLIHFCKTLQIWIRMMHDSISGSMISFLFNIYLTIISGFKSVTDMFRNQEVAKNSIQTHNKNENGRGRGMKKLIFQWSRWRYGIYICHLKLMAISVT